MKIDKIQCDICGKLTDYNSKRIADLLKASTGVMNADRMLYSRYKNNKLMFFGIMKQEKDVLINVDFDLCEECLIELYKMINKWKDQRSEENEFSS